MSALVPLFPVDPHLEDVILEALAAARAASRGDAVPCPVCGGEAHSTEVEQGIYEIACGSCKSVLSEFVDEPVELRLAS